VTWLADHRATHGPESYCADCRPPDAAGRAVPAPRADSTAGVLRADLVIQPGSNRK
jgi:hypothetical protein